MGRLTEHFDLIAIMVLAVVLGLAHAPRIHFADYPVNGELPTHSMRILKLQKLVYSRPALR